MNKVVAGAEDAVADITDGASIAVGGFGLVGVPIVLIRALLGGTATHLEIVSNNCGVDGWGLGLLLAAGRIRRVIGSYIGDNREFARQYLAGELEVELTPQGTLAERLRAGGAGIPAFYTPTGVGTLVAEGGLPWRYGPNGDVLISSPAKPTARFDVLGAPADYVMETALRTDFALVRAAKADPQGNLVFEKSARNFNPLVAAAGRTTIAEVDEIVPLGSLDPDAVHLPGVYVDRVIQLTGEQARELPVEKLTTRAEG